MGDAGILNKNLAHLRGLLGEPPSASAWEALCALLDGWDEAAGLGLALDYAEPLLEGWDELLRVLPARWAQPMGVVRDPRARLARVSAPEDGGAGYLIHAANLKARELLDARPLAARVGGRQHAQRVEALLDRPGSPELAPRFDAPLPVYDGALVERFLLVPLQGIVHEEEVWGLSVHDPATGRPFGQLRSPLASWSGDAMEIVSERLVVHAGQVLRWLPARRLLEASA